MTNQPTPDEEDDDNLEALVTLVRHADQELKNVALNDSTQILDKCPNCSGTANTVLPLSPVQYRWCCDNPACLCEYSVECDNAGKVLGVELDHVIGMMAGEDADRRFATIRKLVSAAQAGDEDAVHSLRRGIPNADWPFYRDRAILMIQAWSNQAREMSHFTQEDIARSAELCRQLKAATTPEREEELLHEHDEYVRQQREKARQEWSQELREK